jgi:hypothetical protein
MKGGRPDTLESTPAGWEAKSSQDRIGQAGSDWFLPSGMGLMEVALRAGFVAPVLLGESDEPKEQDRRYAQAQMAGIRSGGSK